MSRWSWHEKKGVRNGPVRRKSDYLSPEDEERIERERIAREYEEAEHLHDFFVATLISRGDVSLQ